VDQLPHHVQTKETNYKNLFLQPDHVPSKHELLLSYMVTVLTVLWPFVQMFSKHLSLVLVVQEFFGEVSGLASVLSNVCPVSTVHFLSGFLSNSGPVVLSLLTR
jgi:hypothetical protein